MLGRNQGNLSQCRTKLANIGRCRPDLAAIGPSLVNTGRFLAESGPKLVQESVLSNDRSTPRHERGPILVKHRHLSCSAQVWPNWLQVRPMLGELGPSLVDIVRIRPTSAETGPNLVEVGPLLVDLGNIGRSRSNFDRNRCDISSKWVSHSSTIWARLANLCRIRSEVGQLWSHMAKPGTNFGRSLVALARGQLRRKSDRIWPNSAQARSTSALARLRSEPKPKSADPPPSFRKDGRPKQHAHRLCLQPEQPTSTAARGGHCRPPRAPASPEPPL